MSDVTVRKRPNGSWEVRWRDAAGRRRGRSIGQKRDAYRFAAELRRRLEVGDLIDLEAGKVTLAEFVEDYWRDYAVPNLAPKTRDVYALTWDKHLRERIGGLPLRELTTPLLTRVRADLSRDGVGDATVLKAFTMLMSVLSHAVVEGHLKHNPARAVREPPQVRARKIDPIPPEVVERIRAVLLAEDDRRSATMVSLMAYGGLRSFSEVAELQVRDVGRKAIRVNARKTRRLRVVDLVAPLALDLHEWLADVEPLEPREAVITRPDGEPLRETDWRNWRTRVYVPAATRAGLHRPRPYDLRHSFVSLLIWEGRNVAEVAAQAGHSVETCSRDYIHVFKESRGTRRVSATTRIWRARKAAGLPVPDRT